MSSWWQMWEGLGDVGRSSKGRLPCLVHFARLSLFREENPELGSGECVFYRWLAQLRIIITKIQRFVLL